MTTEHGLSVLCWKTNNLVLLFMYKHRRKISNAILFIQMTLYKVTVVKIMVYNECTMNLYIMHNVCNELIYMYLYFVIKWFRRNKKCGFGCSRISILGRSCIAMDGWHIQKYVTACTSMPLIFIFRTSRFQW